jgi:xylulokinase
MYLGLDLGTSELKALLLDDAHRVVAVARAALTVQRPQPLWSEQDPTQWWTALEQVMQALRAQHAGALRTVRAIGLSGQMHGAVLLDSAGAVQRPAILWNDGRSAAACQTLTHTVPSLERVAGNLAMPGFTAPKLLWLREHEPGVFARVARVLLPKDWLRLRLTGDAVSEMSDASGTLWLDVGARSWSDELLHACGLDRSHMPRLVEGSEASGTLRADVARRFGLRAGIVVAGGGSDNAASAVGMGAVNPGQGFVSLGTSGVMFAVSDGFRPHPQRALHAFCHALPSRWHQMSVMLSAASAVTWATRVLGLRDEATLMDAAANLSEAQRAQAPLFLPYLSGERSPHNDPAAQGVLFGLTAAHDAASIAHAVVEGVSFGLLDGVESFGAMDKHEPLSLVGGGARSAYWSQLLATVLDRTLVVHEGAQSGGALGAARLAWLADGGPLDQVCARPPQARRFEPRPHEREALLERHRRFVRLYPALRGQFAA